MGGGVQPPQPAQEGGYLHDGRGGAAGASRLELETKVHLKVHNHGEAFSVIVKSSRTFGWTFVSSSSHLRPVSGPCCLSVEDVGLEIRSHKIIFLLIPRNYNWS